VTERASAEASDFDPPRIIEVLDRHEVEYVIVGGFATQLHGTERATYDIEVVPSTSADNEERLAGAGSIDVLTELPVDGGRRAFDELARRRTEVESGSSIRLASREGASGRHQDGNPIPPSSMKSGIYPRKCREWTEGPFPRPTRWYATAPTTSAQR
jgi:hypothetical protein